MTKPARTGMLVISFDLDGTGHSIVDEGALATIDAVLAILREGRMSATWCSASPGSCPGAAEVAAQDDGHEIALRLLSDLRISTITQQVWAARNVGYCLSTLLADAIPKSDALAEFSRAGIRAMSLLQQSQAGSGSWLQRARQIWSPPTEEAHVPRMLRYGLWEIPAAIELPTKRSRACRAVETAADCGDVLHVHAAISRIQQGRAGGLRSLENLVQVAFETRKQHQLTIDTISGLVSQLRAGRTSAPAQSILRRAA